MFPVVCVARSLTQCAAAVLAILAALVTLAPAEPIDHRDVQAIDGDTIRARGLVVRLVGFDAPESGERAQCESERALAARAVFRLRQLIVGGGADLQLIACACRPGTEGTKACNYGRACGVLRARGRDVAAVMIGEGLARPYVCRDLSCPRRQSWCG